MKIKALFSLIRPLNILLAILTVFTAYILMEEITPLRYAILAVLVVALITSSGNILNDVFDWDLDKLIHPKRPLPQGKISCKSAKIWGFSLGGSGIFLSLFIHQLAFFITSLVSLLLFFYNRHFKKIVLFGNIVVGVLAALVFLFAGAVLGRIKILIFPAIFAFFFHVTRELLKDIQDAIGDRLFNMRTFPVIFGQKQGILLARIFFLFLVGLTFIPYLLGIYNELYLILVIVGVNIPGLILLFRLHSNTLAHELGRVSTFMKYDIFLALLALYLGVK